MSLVDALQLVVGIDTSKVKKGVGDIGSMLGKLAGPAAAVAVALGGIGLAVGKGALEAGMQMEAMESRLTTMMGSATEARARMATLFDFAATTPFEVGEVVAAEVTLRGFGAAAEEIMPGLIDFSATTGAALSQSALDFGKAWNQGATGLESDTAKILRKQIEIREGVDASSLSIEDFRAAMLETLDEGMFAGGAAKLSQTMTGMVSNLQDEWTRFELQVSDAGLFDNVKGALSATLELIAENRQGIGDLASDVGTGLWDAFSAVAKVAGVAATGAEAIGLAIAAATEQAANLQLALGRFAGLSAETLAPLVAVRNTAAEWVDETLANGTALERVNQLLGEAENKGKAFGESMAEASKKAGSTAKAPGETGAAPVDDLEERVFARRAEMAIDYYATLADARQTDLEREMAAFDDKYTLNEEFFASGLATEAEYLQGKMTLIDEHESAVAEMKKEIDDAEIARQADLKKTVEDTANSMVGYWQQSMEAIGSILATAGEENKDAQKAFAITGILIDTARGIMAAWAEGPVVGALGSVAVGLTSAAQIAAVVSAHQGGEPIHRRHQGGPGPDEVDTRILRQESVLNSQATRALGEQGVMALNGNGGGGRTTVELVVGRQVQREVVRSDLASGGPMRRYIRSESTRNGLDTGFSGSTALP